jgi:hypothetical protein
VFEVQRKRCATCIYIPGMFWDLERLEDEVRDPYMGFLGYRECHHAPSGTGVCCRGFWDMHKDEFPAGQIAQRLDMVTFVDVDDRRHVTATARAARQRKSKS